MPLYALLVVLLTAKDVPGAITDVTSAGAGTSTTSNTTLVGTTTEIVAVGNLMVVMIGHDNVATTDGDEGLVTGVVTSGGDTITKLCAYTNGQGGAGSGSGVWLGMARLTTQLDVGATVTATFGNAITSKAMRMRKLTASLPVQAASACQTDVMDAVDPPSQTISGLPNKEYLFLRAYSQETDATTDATPTANYTNVPDAEASAGTSATSHRINAELRILTGTGDTSDPATNSDPDGATVFVAVEEISTARPQQPIVFP